MTKLMDQIASEDVLQQAYDWLCSRRKAYSANNDVWDLRWRWEKIKLRLQDELLAGSYQLGAMERMQGEVSLIELWSSLDALVVKNPPVEPVVLQPECQFHRLHSIGGVDKSEIRSTKFETIIKIQRFQ